jgi:hypothetical protein
LARLARDPAGRRDLTIIKYHLIDLEREKIVDGALSSVRFRVQRPAANRGKIRSGRAA